MKKMYLFSLLFFTGSLLASPMSTADDFLKCQMSFSEPQMKNICAMNRIIDKPESPEHPGDPAGPTFKSAVVVLEQDDAFSVNVRLSYRKAIATVWGKPPFQSFTATFGEQGILNSLFGLSLSVELPHESGKPKVYAFVYCKKESLDPKDLPKGLTDQTCN